MYKLFIFAVLFLLGCSNAKVSYPKAENGFDAGREFIDGTLKGDFKKSAFYMLPDSINQQFLDVLEKEYRLKDKEGRQQLRSSSINIQQVEDLDSITSLIHYNNSYDKIDHILKVMKQQDSWAVDFKYSYQKK